MLYYNSINTLQLHKNAGKQHSIVSDSFVLQQVLGPITNKATLAQPKANGGPTCLYHNSKTKSKNFIFSLLNW